MTDIDVVSVLHKETSALLPGIGLSSKLTPDQWQWIQATEADYQLVLKALSLYFSGQEIPYSGSPSDKQWLENWVTYYARLYELIQLCWKPLKENKEQLQLRQDITPGILLAFLLRLQFLAQIHECFLPYSEFSVSKQRQFLEVMSNFPNAKPQQQQTYKIAGRKFLADYEEFYAALLTTLKVASTQASKSRQGSTLRKTMARFQDHTHDMRQASLKRLRSRAPYQWKKGEFHHRGFS